MRGQFSAQPTTKMEQLDITVLINDKSQLKRNVEQIGSQLALKTRKSLSWSKYLCMLFVYVSTDAIDEPVLVLWSVCLQWLQTVQSRSMWQRRHRLPAAVRHSCSWCSVEVGWMHGSGLTVALLSLRVCYRPQEISVVQTVSRWLSGWLSLSSLS